MIASNGESTNYVPPKYDDMQNLQGFGSGCSVAPQANNGETLVQSSLVNYTIISYPAQFKPFVCNVCNKGFSSKNSRDKHYRNLHLMERKECSICRKVFSNIYNLKRHVQGAHGAYMDQKTGVVYTQRNERLQQTPSPVFSEENSLEGQGVGADSNVEFREWDETPIPGSPESRQSSTPCDSISPSSPIKLGGANPQSYFEAFIPPRYHHVRDGNFDEYISDDDNFNFLEDGDDADAILEGLSVKTPSTTAIIKACSSTRQRSPSLLQISPDIGTQSCFFAHLGLVRSKPTLETTASAASVEFTNNNIDSFVNKEIPSSLNGLTQEELLSIRDKQSRLRAEREEIFLEVEAFKNSAEGRAERAKIKRKGKAEKERIRRLWGKASRKSNRVARKKGRESPQDLQPSPPPQSTSGGKAIDVNSDKAVVSQTIPVAPTRYVRVTRQRSKTK